MASAVLGAKARIAGAQLGSEGIDAGKKSIRKIYGAAPDLTEKGMSALGRKIDQVGTTPVKTVMAPPQGVTIVQPTPQNSYVPDKGDFTQDDLDRVRSVRIKSSIYIFGMLGFLLAGLMTAVGFMLYYAISFHDQMSSGQDSLCNFYTCSNSSECGNFPKIIFPDGTERCLTD